MHVRVFVTLGLKQAMAAGEDQIGAPQKLRFLRLQPVWRKAEARQLVHAIINHCCGFDPLDKLKHHGRVEPKDRSLPGYLQGHKIAEKAVDDAISARTFPSLRYMWAKHDNRRVVERPGFKESACLFGRNRFLQEEDQPVGSKAPHQMLRAL